MSPAGPVIPGAAAAPVTTGPLGPGDRVDGTLAGIARFLAPR